jgi:2-dehydro-3-deoxyphosphogluconate aldolase/(4S)-4-hydroxy-2-oxoglutarate aldolase
VISEGVKKIGTRAFSGAIGLSSVVFPTTLETVEERAFDKLVSDFYYYGDGTTTIPCTFYLVPGASRAVWNLLKSYRHPMRYAQVTTVPARADTPLPVAKKWSEVRDAVSVEYEGKIFVLTGFDLNEENTLVGYITQKGGAVKSSVVLATDYLVVNLSYEGAETTKYKRALELNGKGKTIRIISEEKIVMIVRGVPAEQMIPLAEAMYRGGVRVMECTYDATGKTPDTEIAATIGRLAKHFEGRMLIGAGTVIRPEQVDLPASVGGRFIVSPDTSASVIKRTKALGLASLPGALTPTEATTAHRAGADFVKLFPATNLGPAYIKAITAPLSNIKLLAVGGIDENNMADYLKVGICGFGIGTNITNKKMIEEGDFVGIRLLAEKYTEGVKI